MKTELARRLVGWYEYTRALALLDALMNSAREEELQVIEEIIGERDEFAVYTNLSSRLEKAPGSLSEPNVSGAVSRRGLAWMMALARVELGAMAAGFTDHPQPFSLLRPSQYETSAYLEILLDGARTHVLALSNDPVAQHYALLRDRPVMGQVIGAAAMPRFVSPASSLQAVADEQRAIAYARRVLVADAFVQTVQALGGSQLTSIQQAELAAYRKSLSELQSVLLYKVLGIGASESFTKDTKTSRRVGKEGIFCNCPALARYLETGSYQLEAPVFRSGSKTTTFEGERQFP